MNEEFELTVEVEETSSARERVNNNSKPRGLKQRMQLEPGRKYKGSFWVNDYGEFFCKPEQKGTNPDGMKLVKEGDRHKLYTSKNLVKVTITLERSNTDTLSADFTQAVTKAMVDLLKYDFTR